jgi:hypothetical protein
VRGEPRAGGRSNPARERGVEAAVAVNRPEQES